MLKAKVPRSWVKRVLEVDGKDSRVLDLDPELPLKDQRAALENGGGGAAAPLEHVASSTEGGHAEQGIASPAAEAGSSTTVGLPYPDAFASVRTELAVMTGRVGRSNAVLRAVPSDEERAGDGGGRAIGARVGRGERPGPGAAEVDLTSAAVAASNERMERLRAIRDDAAPHGGAPRASPRRRRRGATEVAGGGRRRQTVDEIRRRLPSRQAAGSGVGGRRTFPQGKAGAAGQAPSDESAGGDVSGEKLSGSDEDGPPLKDDPRFSKYFQMIRSRVPRSWVERVIEVDDRDPAILDLDPNKSLASQVGDGEMPSTDDNDTDDSTNASLVSVARRRSALASSIADERVSSGGGDGAAKGDEPPITQIDEAPKEDDDDQSETSTITTLRDTPSSSYIDLNKIGSFLDRIGEQLNDSKGPDDGKAAAASPAENRETTAPRCLTVEDVEKRMAELLDHKKSREDGQNEVSSDHKRLLEKSKADIAKISSLLASNVGKQLEAGGTEPIALRQLSSEQASLENLPALLSQVLSRLEQQPATFEPGKLNKGAPANKALEALIAKQASLLDEQEEQKKILCEDPEYAKYFKMLKLGLPRASVIQALERDGRDVTVIDLDPDLPLEEQRNKNPAVPSKTAALETLFSKRAAEIKEKEQSPNKHAALEALFGQRASDAATAQGGVALAPTVDPEYEKHFNMVKMGMPKEMVRQALERDGKDPSIADMDPKQPLVSPEVKKEEDEVKKEEDSNPPIKEEYAKFFKMLKMGLPPGAVQNALTKAGLDPEIINMDPEKSYASQTKKEDPDPPIKEEYAKFFKMLKMGLPPGAVQNALTKAGLDPEIINMDPEKSYSSQIKQKGGDDEKDDDPPLKDDEKYTKYFKMLKMGLPLGAVQNALQKAGLDPEIINLDPEKSLASQQKSEPKAAQKPSKPKGPKVTRKRLHWNKIDESTLHEDSFWNQAKDSSLQLVGLDFDNEEFASLFTSSLNKVAAPKKAASSSKKYLSKQKVQLIDGRRRMNGSILLTKFKVNFKVLARQVDNMECIEAEGNELRGMMQLLPTKDESLALRSYLPPQDAPQSEYEESITKLGECEQYMAAMLDVPDAEAKFQSMLFRADFESHTDNIRDGAQTLIQACDSVINSERFRKLLLYALKLGNALNTGGVNEEVTAITLDSLLKLAEAKAFDRQTSALHYLVSIVQKNDEDVLKLSEDFVPVKAAERVAMDMLAKELKETEEGIGLVKDVVRRNMPATVAPILQGGTNGHIVVEARENGKGEGEMEGMDVKGKDDDGGKDDEPPLKDDEEYAKFFKMLKMGVPLGAVQDAMQEAGLDPEILDFDPEKSLASQQKLKSKAAEAEGGKTEAKQEGEDDDSFQSCVSILEEKGETGVQDNTSDSVHGTPDDVNKFRSGWSSTPKMPNQIQMFLPAKVSEGKLPGFTTSKVPDQVQMLSTSDMSEDELLGYTPMGRFSLGAASKIQALSSQFDEAQRNFTKVLQFFGEDNSMTPEAFFCTINTFVSMFEQTHKELIRKQEAKERKKRIEEKRQLREQEMAAKKLISK